MAKAEEVFSMDPKPLDEKKENKTEKSRKAKKIIKYTALVLAGIIIAVLLICLYNYAVTGASSPEKAIASYLRASMLYDTKNMVEYASDYQKRALNDGKVTSDGTLKSALDKFYDGKESEYKDKEITFSLTSVTEYEGGSKKFDEYIKKYNEKADAENIKKIAVVKMTTLINGKKDISRTYIAVKRGFRWYYGFADA